MIQNIPTQERFAVPPTDAYTRQDWQSGYESQRQESSYWIENIEGEIPAELEGTFFRNGPGLFDINGQPIHHPFDGDGMICSVSFSGQKAYFQNRFVRTQAFLEEQKAGKILYRGVFGTQKPGGWFANAFDFNLKNIANTSIVYWGQKLLALWEAAEPHRLNPKNLETEGLDHLDGILNPGDAFAAHYKVDPQSVKDGKLRLVNFSIKPGLSTTITIFELDESGKLLEKHAHSVPGFAFIHDFAITPHYCLFFQNPVEFNPIPFVLGMRGAGECIKFQPNKPTKIIVIPRDASGTMQVLETPSGFVFHHANAWEIEPQKLQIDSICYASFPEVEANSDFRQVKFEELSPGQLWRFTLDLKNQTVERNLLEGQCCEFPSLHPEKVGRSYRYVYLGAAHQKIGNAPLQAFIKLDLETQEQHFWTAAPRGFTGEPIFVPKPNGEAEDDGWVVSLIYDAEHHRSDVVILDAKDLKLLARLHLNYHIPYGLHGYWTPQTFID